MQTYLSDQKFITDSPGLTHTANVHQLICHVSQTDRHDGIINSVPIS